MFTHSFQLHVASANGYSKVVEYLLENHAAVDAVDRDLWTPAHAAACWGHVCTLWERERGKNLLFPSSYSHTHTHKLKISTHPTVISSHVQRIKTVSVDLFQMEILEMLAMSGADLNAKNKNDETPSGKSSILWLYTRTTHSSSYLILTLST